MPNLHHFVKTFLLFLTLFFAFSVRAEENEEERKSKNDYEIYEAIDTMTSLTGKQSFYDLIGVTPSTDSEEIGRVFRKMSVKYHPDKKTSPSGGPLSPEEYEKTEKLYKLIQYVGSLLRDPKYRARYDWIMNEAPAWHRQSYYMRKIMRKTSKLSLLQVLWIAFGFITGSQLLLQWCKYGLDWIYVLYNRNAVKGMGEKEVKRLKKRLAQGNSLSIFSSLFGVGDVASMSLNNSSYMALSIAHGATPKMPSPLDLLVFSVPMSLAKLCFGRFLTEKGKRD